jgi:periplasmic protein TonB
MSLEPEKASGEIPDDGLGSLRGCLMDGDAEQRRRQRSIRHRSLAISIAVQSAILTALILVSLFGKPQRIALANITPIPPFGRPAHRSPAHPKPPTPQPPVPGGYTIFPPRNARPITPTGESPNPVGPADFARESNAPTDGSGCSWCVGLDSKDNGRRPQPPPPDATVKARLVRVTRLDPAMLIHRVEPVYPPLAKQIHREGRVELRAIIGTDGTIQSLQIVSGDPIFLRSALDAVEQWHYKPTILNGQPVEIDTYISVVYTMQH